MRLGPWMMKGFGLLAKLKGLRGTAFDLFGRTEERRTERALIAIMSVRSANCSAPSPARTTQPQSPSPPSRRRSAASAM